MNTKRRPCHVAAEVAAAIMAGPKYVLQITQRCGLENSNSNIVAKYVNEFHESGCIYIKEWFKGRYPVYAWQPELFRYADVQRPGVTPVAAASEMSVVCATAAKL